MVFYDIRFGSCDVAWHDVVHGTMNSISVIEIHEDVNIVKHGKFNNYVLRQVFS